MASLGRPCAALIVVLLVAACAGGAQPTASDTSAPPSGTPAATPTFPATPTAAATPPPTLAATGTPTAALPLTIETGGGPCGMAALDGSIWVTNNYDANLVRIDGSDNAVSQTVDTGTNPCGIAALDGKLWVAVLGDQSLIEYDPAIDEVTRTIDTGGQPWDVEAGHGSIWVPVRGPNVLMRIDPADGTIAASIPISGTVTGAAVTTAEVWVASQSGRIERIDPATNAISDHIDLEAPPYWFAVGSDSVIATESGDSKVVVLDQSTGELRATVSTDPNPRDPGFVGGNFWVTSQASGMLSIVSEAGELLDSLPVPAAHGPFLADEALGDGWILNYSGTTVVRLPADFGLR